MKKMMLMFILCLLSYSVLAEEKSLMFGHEVKPNPPYFFDESSENYQTKPGISKEVFNLAGKRAGVKINYKAVPWKRGLTELQSNELDGLFHSSFQAERLEMGAYPMKDGKVDENRRLMTQKYALYKLKSSPLAWDGKVITNLNDEKIGAMNGYAILGDLEKMAIPVDVATSQINNLRKLVLGRIAGIADLENFTDRVIRENAKEFKDVVKMEPPLSSKPYYLMISHKVVKEAPELAEAIWNEIGKIRESGEYDKIAEKYLN